MLFFKALQFFSRPSSVLSLQAKLPSKYPATAPAWAPAAAPAALPDCTLQHRLLNQPAPVATAPENSAPTGAMPEPNAYADGPILAARRNLGAWVGSTSFGGLRRPGLRLLLLLPLQRFSDGFINFWILSLMRITLSIAECRFQRSTYTRIICVVRV